MPRPKNYPKRLERAQAEFTKKYPRGSCGTTTTAVDCDRQWHSRTFGLAVPLWDQRLPKESWKGLPRHYVDIRAVKSGAQTENYVWVPEGMEKDYKDDDALAWHRTERRKLTPEESRHAALNIGVLNDDDLQKDLDAWKKKIACKETSGQPACRGPQSETLSESRGGYDLWDLSEHAGWPAAKDALWYAGVCIKLRFKCLPSTTTTPSRDTNAKPKGDSSDRDEGGNIQKDDNRIGTDHPGWTRGSPGAAWAWGASVDWPRRRIAELQARQSRARASHTLPWDVHSVAKLKSEGPGRIPHVLEVRAEQFSEVRNGSGQTPLGAASTSVR